MASWVRTEGTKIQHEEAIQLSSIEQSIEVNVPVGTAYNQWTQFEEFPKFMEGVEQVRQLDDTSLRWVVQIAGQTNAGVVTFHRIDDNTSKVMLQMEYEPEGAVETAGDALGIVKGRIKGDLARFKEFIEARGSETGAWRGG